MADIRLEFGKHEPLPSNGLDANYWCASAIVDGSVHEDAAAMTADLALAALALKLATWIEEHSTGSMSDDG